MRCPRALRTAGVGTATLALMVGPLPLALAEGPGDDEITHIGPTHRLPQSPAGASATPPPDGERERLIWAMEQCGWVQAKAARLLHISPRQLGYALRKSNIEVRKF